MRSALIAVLLPVAGLVAQESPASAEKIDFSKQIAPIFVSRCIECHGPEKDKGDLRLDSREVAFPEGDEDYWAILAGKPEESELLRRVKLPLGDDEIMPEKGEPLSKQEQQLIEQWIREGAVWGEAGDKAIADALAAAEIPMITFELPALEDGADKAIEAAMTALRQQGAVVQRVAEDTDAIDVNLSLLRDKVTDETLKLLEPLAPRLVWLNVSRTAITDASAASLGKLKQLRRLHVANTEVGDGAVRAMADLEKLEFANFYGTKITDDALPFFLLMPALKKLHAWQTGVTAEGAKAARDHFAKFEVDVGDYAEARMAAAQKEIAEREAAKKAEKAKADAEKKAAEKQAAEAAKATAKPAGAPINDKCPVSGADIDPAHVVEFEGRVVALCCGKCKAKFEKDPKKYAGKLPAKTAEAGPINSKCPVSGADVDAAHVVDFEGKQVAFCCGNCKKKFVADPEKYAAKIKAN